MIIGIPKEIKPQESRVGATPSVVRILTKAGHQVLIEKGAGVPSGFSDADYVHAGATVVDTADAVYQAEMIYKVKEPQPEEYDRMREGQILYAYLHLAAEEKLAKALVEKKVNAIAFETVEKNGTLPLLRPMSEVAGRMAVQEGARFLSKVQGGEGILISAVPGVEPAKVVIIGAGVVGTAAAHVAVGMGGRVTILDVNIDRLGEIIDIFGSNIDTLYSNEDNLKRITKEADLVISTVLLPGRKAPKLLTEEMVKAMKPGSVVIDVAIDQGGSTELTAGHPTTHEDPVFMKHDVILYAVANIPGAVPRTSTIALSNATGYYALQIANKGLWKALREHPELQKGLNTANGYMTNAAVACELGYECHSVEGLQEELRTR